MCFRNVRAGDTRAASGRGSIPNSPTMAARSVTLNSRPVVAANVMPSEANDGPTEAFSDARSCAV
jgi:hypothetical protein